ncbi:hypothetical protein [Aliivibrio salmonicida]|uniref:defense against restriction DarA-related protein n=1 Tax=Aliivibrio salmonicida TaxID=40269 RepID=UPI003D09DF6C
MNSFLLSKALHIVNRTVFEAKGLTENQEQLMFSSADAALNLEPASLEDIVNTHLFDFPVGDELLLSAITTKNNRLKATMAALVREMNSALGGKLQAGEEFYSLISEKLKGRVISSAIVSKPRKTGQFAVITALIPLSDGQSISIIFYAPDDDPLKINETDTLIAFRFLLNKRDITHIVAPIEGKDLSLKQTCANLAELALKNTDKFTANKEKSNAEAATLLSIQEQTEAALNEANQIADQADEKSTQIPELNNSIADLNEKLKRNTEANRLLEIEINSRRVIEPQGNGPLDKKEQATNDSNSLANNISAQEQLHVDLMRDHGYEVTFNDKDGYVITEPSGKENKAGTAYSYFKELVATYAGRIQAEIANGQIAEENKDKPRNQNKNYSHLLESYKPINGTSFNKMKAVDIEDGKKHAIVYDEYTSATVYRNDSKVAIDFYIAGGLVKATEEYINIVNAKNAGNESLFRLQDTIRQRFIDNDYTQEELDSIEKIKQERNEPKAIKPVLEPNEPGRIYKQADRVTIGDGRYTIERIDIGAKTATFASSDGSERFTLSKPELDGKDLLIDGIHSEFDLKGKLSLADELKPLISHLSTVKWFDQKGKPTFDLFDDVYDTLLVEGYSMDAARLKAQEFKNQIHMGEIDYFADILGQSKNNNVDPAPNAEPEPQSAPESNTFVSVMTMPRVKTAIANVKADGNNDIASSLSTIEKIDNGQMPGMDRALFVQSITGKIKRIHKNGEQSKVDNALTMISEYNTFSDKPAITNRNAIWKLGEVVNIQEAGSLESDAEQRIKNSEEVTAQKANFWYGMRVRPFSIGSQPDNNAAYIDQTEALTKFADKNIEESDVRYGAVAYQDRLTDDQVDHYNLTDLSIDANADMELGESSVGDAISDWANANGNDKLRVPQSLADELKNTLSSHYESGGSLNAMQKSGLSDYLRDQEAFKNRKEEPNEYKKWVASINAVPLNILHEYVDMFVSHEEAPKEDAANEVQASADSQLISKLNPSDFESGSIYNKEKLTDLTEIAKRIRKDIAGLKKSGKIPSETKISVKKSSGRSIDLTLTGFSSNVPMFDTEWLSMRAAGDDLTGRGYSSEMESLIKYVNALVDQYNYDNSEPMTDYFDVNFYGGRLDVEYQLKNEALERESNQLQASNENGLDSIYRNSSEETKSFLSLIQAHTDFTVKEGPQAITLPTGKVINVDIDLDSFELVIDDVKERLDSDLEQKAINVLNPFIGWESGNTYFAPNGDAGTIKAKAQLTQYQPTQNGDGFYGDKYSIVHHGLPIKENEMRIFPTFKDGAYKLSLYKNEALISDISDVNDLEMNVITLLDLTTKYPGKESDMNANPELQKHLDVISDITNGKITEHNDALVKLKAAGEYIQANDLVDEYEADISSAADVITALMKAAMSAIN